MREKEVEGALVREVKKRGGLCPKWVSPGLDGVPDRIVLLPGGRMAFVELKAPGGKPRPLQVRRINQLRDLGFLVYVLDHKDEKEIMELLDTIGQQKNGGDVQ